MLLGMAACFGTPATNIAILRASYSVVNPGKSADTPNFPRQEIAESRPSVRLPAADSSEVVTTDTIRPPAGHLDSSLFQRPPPRISSRP
jgi:hypothetical protein